VFPVTDEADDAEIFKTNPSQITLWRVSYHTYIGGWGMKVPTW